MININEKEPIKQGRYSSFVSEEKGCKHRADNPSKKEVRQFKIDRGVIPKNEARKRCDYLLLNDTDQRVYYIELKGSTIPGAILQIEKTILDIGPSIPEYEVYCRIIYRNGSHHVRSSETTKWKKKRKGRVIIKERMHTDTL